MLTCRGGTLPVRAFVHSGIVHSLSPSLLSRYATGPIVDVLTSIISSKLLSISFESTPTLLLSNLRAPYRFFDGIYTDLPSIGNILRAHAGHDGLCDSVYTQAAAANSRFT